MFESFFLERVGGTSSANVKPAIFSWRSGVYRGELPWETPTIPVYILVIDVMTWPANRRTIRDVLLLLPGREPQLTTCDLSLQKFDASAILVKNSREC